MALTKITNITGRGIYLPGDDVDTDRIIPARYLKCVTFDGLGEYAFFDERFDTEGSAKLHPMNEARFGGASILLAGSNFGCGSSREHAPQSLYRYGIRAVLAVSFAEIFFGNSIQLGMPCLTLERQDIEKIAAIIEQNPATPVQIDIAATKITCGGEIFKAGLPEGSRSGLVDGRWDPIAELLENNENVDRVMRALPYMDLRK